MTRLIFHAVEKNLDGWNYIPQNDLAKQTTEVFGVNTKYCGKCLKLNHVRMLRDLDIEVLVPYQRNRFGDELGTKHKS